MAFHVGQRVVRVGIDAGRIGNVYCGDLPRSTPDLHEVVTIRTINEWPRGTLLTFVEHDNSHIQRAHGLRYEPGFAAHCFRPVKTTSIEVFTSMLARPPAKTRERA